ncbi:MAG: ATP-binding protein, partial [Aphanizomenon gracile PMC649.10]|nr:ATP-binding protein [Aphanizomenon gracile PMC649.10]
MHIQRIQVPDFRALKNVDITFEKEFTPRIFPFGSQNGGGKSTLLQLIFVLLHCAGNPDRVEFIQNLLYGFHVNDESGKRKLAIIDIWDGNKTVTLDFFICSESYIVNLLNQDDLHSESYIVNSLNQDDEQVKLTSFYEEKLEKYISL